jgi:hypothetical protein
MAGLVPAIHVVGQTAKLETYVARSMQAFRWSSANQTPRSNVDGRDKPSHDAIRAVVCFKSYL